VLKTFKELTTKQKTQAIDYMYQRGLKSIHQNKDDTISKKIKEIKQRIKFCHCHKCEDNLLSEIRKDNFLRELLLDQARDQAENAYYPEENDVIIKVK